MAPFALVSMSDGGLMRPPDEFRTASGKIQSRLLMGAF
jgi:hypothetical protein